MLQAGPCTLFERMVPNVFSANAITLMGQAPLQIMVFVALLGHSWNVDPADPLPREQVAMIGFALIWFVIFDIMDGNRARRLKVGSPLGRLIDEGGDTITESNMCVLLAYAWILNNPFFEIVFFSFEYIFFSMEVRNVVTGKLVMQIDELSPVELEIIFSITCWLLGYYGRDGLYKTVGESFGIPAGSNCPLHVLCEYQWIFIIGVILGIV